MEDYILLGYDVRKKHLKIRGHRDLDDGKYYQGSKDIEIWPQLEIMPDTENEFCLYSYDTAKQFCDSGIIVMVKAKKFDVNFLSSDEADKYDAGNATDRREWLFIGLDVIDKLYFYSALSNFGINLNDVTGDFAGKMTEYGLFCDYASADSFARSMDTRADSISHAPFFPVALFINIRTVKY